MDSEWTVQAGDLMTRDERKARFGGSPQGGIVPSRSSPNVFIYSDPSEVARYGYNFDGWTEDDDLYFYTGTGRVGDQVLSGVNGSVLHHRPLGRTVRLFIAHQDQHRGGKIHRYVGEFEVDAHQPFRRVDAPDESGDLRCVIVFRLRPVGSVDIRPEDRSDAEPESSIAALVDVEVYETESFETAAVGGTTAHRHESALAKKLEAWLTGLGHEVHRWALRPAGELRSLWTDTYDKSARELYEVKGTANRWAIRLAIGQLLDYKRHVPVSDLRLAVAVPTRPSADLVDLLLGSGMACVFPDAGGFLRLEPLPTM